MRILLLFLLLVAPVNAELASALSYDLNGDGKPETIGLRKFQQGGVTLGQLVVLDHRAKVLWEGPRRSAEPTYPPEPCVFLGDFDRGVPEAVGDFDGDGKVELIGSWQKSDVSPTRFRLLRWNGKAFVHVKNGNLVPAPQRPATFVWTDRPQAEVWLDEFVGRSTDGLWKVKITDLSGKAYPAETVVRPTADGFVLAR
ncbi:MAG: hypothetical protein HY319_16850 [Armatimonadetes bacterium]|nr:hypothetical protein [Armatimonadota bacterium]